MEVRGFGFGVSRFKVFEVLVYGVSRTGYGGSGFRSRGFSYGVSMFWVSWFGVFEEQGFPYGVSRSGLGFERFAVRGF